MGAEGKCFEITYIPATLSLISCAFKTSTRLQPPASFKFVKMFMELVLRLRSIALLEVGASLSSMSVSSAGHKPIFKGHNVIWWPGTLNEYIKIES